MPESTAPVETGSPSTSEVRNERLYSSSVLVIGSLVGFVGAVVLAVVSEQTLPYLLMAVFGVANAAWTIGWVEVSDGQVITRTLARTASIDIRSIDRLDVGLAPKAYVPVIVRVDGSKKRVWLLMTATKSGARSRADRLQSMIVRLG